MPLLKLVCSRSKLMVAACDRSRRDCLVGDLCGEHEGSSGGAMIIGEMEMD